MTTNQVQVKQVRLNELTFALDVQRKRLRPPMRKRFIAACSSYTSAIQLASQL